MPEPRAVPTQAGPRDRRPARADDLPVAGLTRLSTCDWPGRLVATAFLQGCPWRCTYCHNTELLDPRVPGSVPWSTVRDHLGARVGLLDGLVLSGGEPTMHAALPAAMREVRAAGFGVGLHTGGAYPRRLEEVLGLVDWVGLDIKAPPDLYPAVTRVGASARGAFRSLELVLAAGVDVQVRTTVDPTVLGPGDVTRLQELVRDLGVREHVLQTVRTEGTSAEYQEAYAAQRVPGPSHRDVGPTRSPGTRRHWSGSPVPRAAR